MFDLRSVKDRVKSDANILHVCHLGSKAVRSTPAFTARYLVDKVPIIQWLPQYNPRWIVNDLIAGITIGVLLVPQSLAYAKVANIPEQYGLISSWIPTALYTIMGTSKDLTAGPTVIMALLTGDIVNDLVKEGYSDHSIATAVAFFVGVYSMGVGMLRLGWILDFIPLPVLTGYVSAAALTIVIGQVPTLFGETISSSDTGPIIREFFLKLPETQWQSFLVGWSGVLLLFLCQYLGRKWGQRHRIIWFLSITRNAIALLLFTGISYAVNHGRASPVFPIAKTVGTGIKAPSVPDMALLARVTGKAVAVWLAAALEHVAIGKAFGRRHKYAIDQSQELTYIGVANFLGSFFSAMPITGGFSRTAVNSESGVKSPLGGLVTTACVLVSIYTLTGAFYWIPKATLSAVIVTAVWPIIIGPATFWKYWKISFIDFVASQLSFWVTLFVSVEVGIATGVAFSIVYVLLRITFSQATLVTSANIPSLYPEGARGTATTIPEDTLIFRLNDAVLFPNAYRLKSQIVDTVTALHAPDLGEMEASIHERLWNESRKQNPISSTESRAPLRVLVLDVSGLNYIDSTGMQMLLDLKAALLEFAGSGLLIEFVGVHDGIRQKFDRANWQLQTRELQ
ncbi:sulfate permease [Cryphonectria parasitica EP155]|uniref:Sulfate permease n=1 Tax=Cryphonectria parasitica (strain ATCC 38755 / EP155) TaxID=660469 RepID=A0A9P5CJD3_CRYP1|nr:sulfate permease [Cryphonectria parasitica EP155]KAF3759891.1 sulfate permease [Cryphonectria parasitica EP155]